MEHDAPAQDQWETALQCQWGENIADRRVLCEYPDRQSLARDLGVSYVTVWRWETGERAPSPYWQMRLARVLRTEVGVLFPVKVPEEQTS